MKRILLSIIVLSLAATAQGQLTSWDCKDGPHIGFVTGGDVRNEDFAFGWQSSVKINDIISIELAISRQDDELEERVDYAPIPDPFAINMETWALGLTARAAFEPIDRVRIYAGAGIGYYFLKSDAEDVRRQIDANRSSANGPVELVNFNVEVDNDFGLLAAGGVEIDLTEQWELFAEYRFVSLEPDATVEIQERRSVTQRNAIYEDTLTQIPDQLPYDHSLVRVGLNYQF